jgi:ketosteroid isomerase-like protein
MKHHKEATMAVKSAEENIVQTLRHALEERDVDMALSLYAEHAEVRIVDHDSPPNSPTVFRGREHIAEYLRRLHNEETAHHVGAALQDLVMGRDAYRST